MLYKVMHSFGPRSGDEWVSYIAWTHQKKMQRFDSADGMLREDCFEPKTKEDWENCVNEHCKLNLITNLDYARMVHRMNPGSEIIGVDIELDEEYEEKEKCLGYDIIDEDCHISLITNWGTDGSDFDGVDFKSNGLIADLVKAIALRDRLRIEHADDAHASGCHVWAIYEISP